MTAEPENRRTGESGNIGPSRPSRPLRPVEDLYRASFFRFRSKPRHSPAWRAPIVCGAIRDVLQPTSVVDAGCGNADLVAEFHRMGLEALGIEGSRYCLPYVPPEATERVYIHDLRLPLPRSAFRVPRSLALSFEVAEHIEPEYATQFVTNLCALSDRVLLSAAPPGQRGHGHVNCRLCSYWVALFFDKGFHREPTIEQELKARWNPWRRKPGIKAYYDNLLYFTRRAPS